MGTSSELNWARAAATLERSCASLETVRAASRDFQLERDSEPVSTTVAIDGMRTNKNNTRRTPGCHGLFAASFMAPWRVRLRNRQPVPRSQVPPSRPGIIRYEDTVNLGTLAVVLDQRMASVRYESSHGYFQRQHAPSCSTAGNDQRSSWLKVVPTHGSTRSPDHLLIRPVEADGRRSVRA
jgi:hypothetical protein